MEMNKAMTMQKKKANFFRMVANCADLFLSLLMALALFMLDTIWMRFAW